MKKLMRLPHIILLITLICIITGCSTTAQVAVDRLPTNEVTFVISRKYDPIGVGDVIAQELRKRGYTAQFLHRSHKASTPRPELRSAFGNGFFISKNGTLIASAHVVSESSTVIVRKTDGEEFMAKVLVTDMNNDVAILKPIKSVVVSNWLSLEQSERLKVGDTIRVISFPISDILANRPRITEGIISADAGLAGDPTCFQLSASILPGNSGGPVVTEGFQVVGIMTEKISDFSKLKKTGAIPQNVSLAVRANYASLLFSDDLENSIEANPSSVDSWEDATEATALVAVNVDDDSESRSIRRQKKKIVITYSYSYSWDVIHYTLSRLNMQWVDEETGEIMARGTYSGPSFSSYVGIVRNLLDKIFAETEIR